jgi:large subunit ribosomal protein L13
MQTPVIKKEQVDNPEAPAIERKWYVVDASTLSLGRTASRVAMILRGKNKPQYTPHVDVGDFVIVINAKNTVLTGRKKEQKMYYRHTGWVGGLKERNAKDMLKTKPTEVVRLAVKGMLPKGRLGRQMLKKLKVYPGAEHPHQAQKPETLAL